MTKLKRSGEDPEIRSMRVRAWVQAVKQASGLSLAELEERFSQRWAQQSPALRSCIWEKYQRGEVVPRASLRTKEGLSLVERVEEQYPGTARWLLLPLWRVVDKTPIEMREIRKIYEELPYLFRSIFVAAPHETSELFWRRPVNPKDALRVLSLLIERDALSALTTILIMVKEAEITQDQYQHALGIESVWECFDLMQDEIFLKHGLQEEIRAYLETRWEEVRYVSVGDWEEGRDNDESTSVSTR